jgi:VIT1/CCC1 family predicted Fe2+/Mn2+ transporter
MSVNRTVNSGNTALVAAPNRSKALLNPFERISEILFGLIMALTFTCTINILESGRTEVRDTLIAALGCNIAWGLVDAVMYILGVLSERGRNKTILNFIRSTNDTERAREFISDALPPILASVISKEQLDEMRKALLSIPESSIRIRLTKADLKIAIGIFLLVFISTFPVVIPFLLVSEPQLALRVSNLVAIILMFICGWLLASYGNYNKIVSSLTIAIIGVLLVGLTIMLGG